MSRIFKWLIFAFLITFDLCLTGFAWAKTQVQELTEAATSGNVGAQLQLAYIYKSGEKFSDGTTVLKDSFKALEWFKSASTSTNASTQQISAFEIGRLYTGDSTIPVDLVQATHWLAISSNIIIPNEKRSTELRAEAMNILGQIYLEECLWIDISGPICATPVGSSWKDDSAAAQFFEGSVQLGNSDARLYLATMYRLGKGVPQNFVKSFELLRTIADEGNVKNAGNENFFVALGKLSSEMGKPIDALMWYTLGAAENDDEAALLRDKARFLLTPDEVVSAQKLADDWLHKHR